MLYWLMASHILLLFKLPIFVNATIFILVSFSIKKNDLHNFWIGFLIAIILFVYNPFNKNELIADVLGDELVGHCYFVDGRGCDFYTDYNGSALKFKVKYWDMAEDLDGKFIKIAGFKSNAFMTSNFNSFNEKKYLISKGYAGVLKPEYIELISSNKDQYLRKNFYNIRKMIMRKGESLSENSKILFNALILGEIGNSKLYNLSKELGIIHIFVISGFHFTLIVGSFRKIILKIIKHNYHFVQFSTIMFATCFLFINKIGFGSTRAYTMLVLSILCFYMGRRYDAKRFLFLIVGTWSFINPYSIHQLGFQISFMGTYAIIISQKFLEHRKLKNTKILSAFILTAFVSIFISPFIIYHFGVGVLAQIFILPILSPIIVFFMYISIIYSLDIFNIFSGYLAHIIEFLADGINLFLNNVMILSKMRFEIDYILVVFLIVAIVVIAVFNRRLIAFDNGIIYPLSILIASIVIVATYVDFGLSIKTFSLRDGESYLIRMPSMTIVYDVGNDFEIVNLLKKSGVDIIDLLVISHGDLDHDGMVNQVLKEFKVKRLISELKERKVIKANNFEIILDKLNEENLSKNDSSIIMKTKYRDVEFVFNGDIENKGIRFLLDEFETYDKNIHASKRQKIIKLPHHASYRKNLHEMVAFYEPDFAIISGGRGRNIKKRKTLLLLEKFGIKVYDTNMVGEINLNYFMNKWMVKANGL